MMDEATGNCPGGLSTDSVGLFGDSWGFDAPPWKIGVLGAAWEVC